MALQGTSRSFGVCFLGVGRVSPQQGSRVSFTPDGYVQLVCRPHSSCPLTQCVSPAFPLVRRLPSGDPRRTQLSRLASPLLTAPCAQRAVVWMRGVCSCPLVMGAQAASGFCFPLWNK